MSSYVDQLELQQKILIKALKETWRVYGPAESQITGDMSIHDIVKTLGVLKDAPGYQPISADFTFNETLANAPVPSTKLEITPPPSDGSRTGSSEVSFDGYPSPTDTCSQLSTFSTTFPTSAAPSLSCGQGSVTAKSLNGFGFGPLEVKSSGRGSAVNSARRRPTFCPLPSRPQIAPVKPTPVDWTDISAYSGRSHSSTSDPFSSMEPNWANEITGNETMAPNFDQGLSGLSQMGEEGWNSWVNDNNGYDAKNFNLLSSLRPNGC